MPALRSTNRILVIRVKGRWGKGSIIPGAKYIEKSTRDMEQESITAKPAMAWNPPALIVAFASFPPEQRLRATGRIGMSS
jgi:hypothetical protein